MTEQAWTPEAVERLRERVQQGLFWENEVLQVPDFRDVDSALRAYADLLRRVEALRELAEKPLAWYVTSANVLKLLDGEPGGAR